MTDIQMSFAMGPNPQPRDWAVKPSGIDLNVHKVSVSELSTLGE